MTLTGAACGSDLRLRHACVQEALDEFLPVHSAIQAQLRSLVKRPCVKLSNHNCAMTALRDRLKEARKEAGLSQGKLAKLAHCGQTTIASIENGRNQGSTVLPRLADILKVEPLWLAEGKGPKQRSGVERQVVDPSQGSGGAILRAAEHVAAVTDAEQELLRDLRELLPDKREAFAKEIRAVADEARAYKAMGMRNTAPVGDEDVAKHLPPVPAEQLPERRQDGPGRRAGNGGKP